MKRKVNLLAFSVLGLMLILMLSSVWEDSATMDELAHIPAGFGYVKEKDFRLNPEHPPLIKTLAGFVANLAARPNFPLNTPYWREDVNGQWAQGASFLYESGNNADRIIFWARFPLILLSILFGWVLFSWTKNHFGSSTALFTLLLYAFSPTVLAHSRYVTTDLGAAFGFFVAIIAFLRFLEKPDLRNIILTGLAFGLGQLLKFSLILLIPIYGFILLCWVLVIPNLHLHERVRVFGRYLEKIILVGLIGVLLIWMVYIPHTINYPAVSKKEGGTVWNKNELTEVVRLPEPQRSEAIKSVPLSQMRDTIFTLSSFGGGPDPEGFTCNPTSGVGIKRRVRCLAEITIWATDKPILRAFAQYILGVLMVIQRSAGGNTAFFLGEVSAAGSPVYFPLLYLFKEPLALHILTLIALVFTIRKIFNSLDHRNKNLRTKVKLITDWIRNHFIEFSSLIFIIIYWLTSIRSPLNIGIRHVLPTFPFIYLLVSQKILEWLRWHEFSSPKNLLMVLKNLYQIYIKVIPKYLLVCFLLIWLIGSTITTFPNFLSYYNELGGGTKNGYNIATDSNYDWGQDLKRLQDFVEENKIEKIAIDYFGGGSPRYYLGDKFEPWWSARGPAHGWFAISATFRQGAFGTPAKKFERKPEDSYGWLKPFEPAARAGHSIFIYKLP